MTADLGPLDRRRRDLARLVDEPWDVVIVGGGIVGAGALLDAASRGLRAALVEQEDIAAGTSSRSSRLIHGGLRYLEQLRLPLVREALAERRRLLQLAPHLVSLEPLLFPIFGWPFVTKAFYDAGLTLYDGYASVLFEHDVSDPTSLSDNAIRTVFEDRAGYLWIGTNAAGLDRLDRSTWTFKNYHHDSSEPASLSHDSVYAIAEDRQGRLWVGTQNGLNRLDP